MENHNRMHTTEPDVLCNGDPCCNNVCISQSRYEELIRAEMEREILFHAYQITEAYNMEYILDAIFNPKFKCRSTENTGSEAGAKDTE